MQTDDVDPSQPSPSVATRRDRDPDRLGALLAAGFIVLLLATESMLTLPDESADDSAVATFYSTHSAFIIALQVVGFLAAGLLAAYSWRLRAVDRVVGTAGLLVSLAALAPGLVTLILAVIADPSDPGRAGQVNQFEPRADDVLFVGILIFAVAVCVRLGRGHPALGVLGAVVALSCLARLVFEIAGRVGGPLEMVAPLSFLLLVAVLALSSFRGTLRRADLASR
jgi:hypothetical protein